jgi:uncharacterized membrane protein
MDDTGTELARMLIPLFNPLCHRNPSRSFLLADGTALLCARCMGLYAGAFAGAVGSIVWKVAGFRLASRPEFAVLLAAIALTPLEVGGEIAGLWDGTRALRAVLGVLTGAALACAIIRAMGEGAAAPTDRNQGWLRVVPLLLGGALLPMILLPHRWGTFGTMTAAAVFSLGLLTLVGAPLVLAAVFVRRTFSD